MYRFNRRTAEPLEPLSAPGCDKPTSRCQITPSIGTLKSGKPVIPSVPFIFWAMSKFGKNTGSLWPTSVPARSQNLAVKQASTIELFQTSIREAELTFANPRCFLEGDRPSQTASPALFRDVYTFSGTPQYRHGNNRVVFHLSHFISLAQN